MEYIVGREEWPEYYATSKGWYSKYADQAEILHLIPKISGDMHRYYAFLLKKCPDVLDVAAVSELTGYGRSTVISWCSRNVLQHFFCRGKDLIPKKYLIDFFCSPSFRGIPHKSEWHLKILAAYPGWKHKKEPSATEVIPKNIPLTARSSGEGDAGIFILQHFFANAERREIEILSQTPL